MADPDVQSQSRFFLVKEIEEAGLINLSKHKMVIGFAPINLDSEKGLVVEPFVESDTIHSSLQNLGTYTSGPSMHIIIIIRMSRTLIVVE